MASFAETVQAAVADVTRHGFDTQRRLDGWLEKIRAAARRALIPEAELDRQLRATLTTIYTRMTRRGGMDRYQIGTPRFTRADIKPRLRAELERRIMVCANMIRRNRQQAIEKTLQRFAGWMSSVPAGGSDVVDKVDTKSDIRKSLAQLPFEERRVCIDQGHKLISVINEITARDGGAIAGIWRSNYRQKNYDYRQDHRERDDKVYLVRDSWAHQRGYVKPGKVGYTDEITQPAEEPFCRCYYVYVYSLNKIPDDMLTEKGREQRDRAKRAAAEL